MKKTFTKFLAALALLVFFLPSFTAWADSETITFSELNLTNGTQYLEPFGTNISVTFAGGENDGKYYTTGSGIRTYGGGTITITANGKTVTAISTTFSGGSYAPSATTVWTSNGTTSSSTSGVDASWSGSATEVVMTRPSGNGHWRLQAITVTYSSGGTPVETVATPTFSPAAGTYTSAQTVSISCATSGATIHYTTDGTVPTTSSDTYSSTLTISETTTIKAMAVKSGMNNSAVATAEFTINAPYSGPDYVRVTDITALTDGTTVIIAARYNSTATSYYAMTAATTGKPTGVSFTSTTSSNGEILPATIVNDESTYKWTVGVSGNEYTFTNAGNQVLGYSSSTNFATGGDNTAWTITRTTSGSSAMVGGYEGFYIINKNQNGRGIALNNQYNYGPYATSNNNSSDYNFYLDIFVKGYVPAAVATPTFTPAEGTYYETQSVTISCATTGADIYYTTDGTEPDANSTKYTSAINVSTTTTIKAKAYYGGANSAVATATYTIAQPISTIPALFDAATSTASNVKVTFGSWVVSGVSTNGYNVFVTDGTNGFVINGGEHGFEVGNILTSTTPIACTLQKSNGYAKVTGINASTENLNIGTGGTVTPANINMANLVGVNTGALVSYQNLVCSITTSGDNNQYTNYNLSDGSTTIQVYNSLFAFDALEDGHYYDITGIYQQYNSTKEILPRSAADIVEVPTPPTITASDVNIAYDATSGSITYTISNEPDPAGTLTAVSSDNWLTIGTIGVNIPLSCTANSLATARTATVTLTYTYNGNKTVTATVNVTQATNTAQGGWVLASLSELTSSDIFVIVGTDADDDTFALPNNGGNSAPAATSVTINSTTHTLSGEPAENLQWNLSGNASDGYTFYPNGNSESWLYCNNTNNGVRVGTNENKLFHMDNNGYMVHNATSRVLSIYVNSGTPQDWRCYGNYDNNPVIITFYKKVNAPVIPSYTLTINQYTTDENGWNLIASPIASEIPASSVTNLVSNTYDLYYFDPNQTKQWVNYKNSEGNASPGFGLVAGKGYLYANSATVTLTFTGTLNTTSTVTLAYDGWNLIGNSSVVPKYYNGDYYIMNSDGSGIIASEREGKYVNAMEGIFVNGDANDEITFSSTAINNEKVSNSKVVLNIVNNSNKLIDRAIARLNSDRQMTKFQLFEGDTKIYFPMEDADYAIVSSDGHGSMPVNFKAKEMGRYTISVETEGIDMSYLHLIDRLTGEDINLLLDNEYSFIASNNDSEERFILSFTEKGYDAHGNEIFVYQSGNDLIVNGEGELQIFDVMGRMVKNTVINGVEAIAMPQGVYIFRLNENIQKIVVR